MVRDARAHGRVSADDVRRRRIGVDAEVDVAQRAQLGLEQDVFPRFGRFVQIQPSVADIRLEDVAVFHEPRPHIIRADRRPSVHALYGEIFVGHDIRQARFCRLRVEQIAHAQGLFHIFVAVNGCDAAACGAVFRIRKTVLLVAVQQLVVRHADDRPL